MVGWVTRVKCAPPLFFKNGETKLHVESFSTKKKNYLPMHAFNFYSRCMYIYTVHKAQSVNSLNKVFDLPCIFY